MTRFARHRQSACADQVDHLGRSLMTIKKDISGVAQNVYTGFEYAADFGLMVRKFRFAAKAEFAKR
ncbi:hypothetical protein [Polaromonas sp.]|uniref:hypothetical protein n=1 Tax=Polaromonas sp. TaxID=1869339 RepID=UPI00356275D0